MTTFDQRAAAIRFEWGLEGLQALAPVSDVIVIVDVLSFTTCVDMAVGNGALVYPYQGPKEKLAGFAASVDALYAAPGREQGSGYALSPASLAAIPAGTRLVLPSPNGSRLSPATGQVPTLAGCLRNADAVGAAHAFAAARPTPAAMVQECGSGQELIARGFAEDVALAGQLNVSRAAPQLIDGAYRQMDRG